MKLEEGMYVRLQNDVENVVVINKIANIFDNTILTENDGSIYQGEYTKENIIKASYNIIDLIEEGDYVNGKLVTKTNSIFPINNSIYIECYCEMNGTSLCWCYSNEEIKTIVTKEQFESMQYEVK